MFNLSGTKQLMLQDGSYINYELIKKYRRSISLKITPKGLVVNAPILMANYKINQLLPLDILFKKYCVVADHALVQPKMWSIRLSLNVGVYGMQHYRNFNW